jgi:photosystem II stability/assembly factor-like uncharacterized protein
MQPYRHYLILAIICLIFGSFPLDLHAQWEQTNGPEGSVVYDVILHNGRMWTATQGGLYFSDDMAETWQLNPVVSQRDAVISLHFFEEKLFIVAVINEQDLDPIITKKQLYVSSDNGLNWTMNHEFHERTYHLNLTKITHIVDKLCYENEYKNLYKSDDYGQTWDSIIAPGFHSKFNYHNNWINK